MARKMSKKQKFVGAVKAASAAGIIGTIETGKAVASPESQTKKPWEEGAKRFSTLLSKFPPETQEFLKHAENERLLAFLQERGIDSPESYLPDRENWLLGYEKKDNEEEEEKKHENHSDQHSPDEKEVKQKNGPEGGTEEEPKPKISQAKSGEKLWGPETNYSEPLEKPTIPKQSFRPKSISKQIQDFGRPENTAGETTSSLWGQGTGFSEPNPQPTTKIPNPRSFNQRLSRPTFRPQTRIINVFNRGVRSTGRASAAGKKAAGAVTKAGSKALAQLTKLLFTTPEGWLILGIFLVGVAIIAAILIISSGSSQSSSEGDSCGTPVCFYVDGPSQVANGADICYSITVIADTVKQPDYTALTLFDQYSATDLGFTSASGNYFPATPSGEVDWVLGNNPFTTTGSLCPGTDIIAPDTSVKKAFYFNLKMKAKATANDSTVENSIGIR